MSEGISSGRQAAPPAGHGGEGGRLQKVLLKTLGHFLAVGAIAAVQQGGQGFGGELGPALGLMAGQDGIEQNPVFLGGGLVAGGVPTIRIWAGS